eukprot:2926765-Pleurochrysis_carterae.AAC.1
MGVWLGMVRAEMEMVLVLVLVLALMLVLVLVLMCVNLAMELIMVVAVKLAAVLMEWWYGRWRPRRCPCDDEGGAPKDAR